MNITINKQAIALPDDSAISLERLMEMQNLPAKGVGIALNNRVIPRKNWAETTVSDGDSITVISAVCGG